jgi:NADH dehydrogenase
LPPTAQVANQQALHLIRHLPAWLQEGKPLPSFRFRDLGALVALSDYNAFGTLGRFGFFTGRFIKGQFARLSHALLYRRLSAGASRLQREPRCRGRPNASTRSCSRRFA